MSIRKRIAKGVGYSVAPKATFAALHPKKAVFAKAAMWLIDRAAPNRRRNNHRRSVAKGLGAAAVTIPVGLWLGRRLKNRDTESQHVGV